jgi:protease-4
VFLNFNGNTKLRFSTNQNAYKQITGFFCMATAKQNKPAPKKAWKIALSILIILIIIFCIALFVKASSDLNLAPAIAVIPIQGEIGVDGSADPTVMSKLIDKANKDITVKAIIFEINSPGGSVVASREIANSIKGAQKPTVAWIREVGASGAFWAATAANKVVADPASLTGSIGVTASYIDFAKAMDKYGITYNELSSGELKETGSPYKDLTPKEKEYLMGKVITIKDLFVAAIAANRNLTFDYVNSKATGEIWLGSEAKEMGFVDVLGGKAEAQATAQRLANLTKSRLVIIEKPKPLLSGLLAGNMQSMAYWIGRGIGDSWTALASNSKIQLGA